MSEPVVQRETSTNIKRSLVVRSVTFLRRWTCYFIWVLVLAGLAMRWTVSDRYHPWALVVYLTPIPAFKIWLALTWLIWPARAIWTIRRLGLPLGRWMALAIVTSLAWSIWSQTVWRGESSDPRRTRIVFWNVARTPMGVESVAERLKAFDAPVIALVEANPHHKADLAGWQSSLPGYTVAGNRYGGVIAVRGEVISQQYHRLKSRPSSWCERFELRVGNERFHLLLVDISSQLSSSRAEPLAALAELVESLSDQPVIVVGDFNTPDDSVWFEPLRKNCRPAFREHGRGYAATWPVPVPVLTLDQVWINSEVTVSRCEHGWSMVSDHRPVLTEFVTGRDRSQ